MRSVGLIAPLVWKCRDELFEAYYIFNKQSKSVCKFNWSYAFKKVMCHIRRVTHCHIKVFKALCESTNFFHTKADHPSFSIHYKMCLMRLFLPERKFPCYNFLCLSFCTSSCTKSAKVFTRKAFYKAICNMCSKIINDNTLYCSLNKCPQLLYKQPFFSKLVRSCKRG